MSMNSQALLNRPDGDQPSAFGNRFPIDRTTTFGGVHGDGSSRKLPSSSSRRRVGISEFIKKYDLPEEIVKKVFESSTTLIEIYHLYGFERPDTLEHSKWLDYEWMLVKFRERMCSYLQEVKDNSAWIAFLKFKTCAFYAFYENQDRPDPPKGLEVEKDNILFTGRAHRWVQLLKNKDRELFESFIVSINLAKKGLPRPTLDMLPGACIKTVRALTTEPYIPEKANFAMDPGLFPPTADNKHSMLTKDIVCQEIKRTVRELFAGKTYTNELHYEPFFPSTSANYIRSRGKAGAVSAIMELIEKFKTTYPISEELVSIELIDVKVRGKLSTHFGELGIKEEIDSYSDLQKGQEFNEEGLSFDDTELKRIWRKLFDIIGLIAYSEQPLVEAVALSEALKIRVISKGPPFLYTFLKPMQKFMWSTLKENSVFEMIGTPLTVQHVANMFPTVSDDEIIVNGDYKASTDNIHGYCSEMVINTLIDKLNESTDSDQYYLREEYREMLIRSLTKHVFLNPEYDPENLDGDVDPAPPSFDQAPRNLNQQKFLPQKEGQLMGSVTSFPVLCIINATLCRMALENTEGIRFRLTDKKVYSYSGCELPLAPVLINGDDCSLKGSRVDKCGYGGLEKNWSRITGFGGLSSSVGKTLMSLVGKPICVLNSQTYHMRDGVWVEIKAVNMGILLGKTRSSGGDNVETKREYFQLGALHRKLKDQCPEKIWSSVSSRFIHYQIETLRQYPNIPWTAPEYLGGPGLIPDKPMSERDLRACSILIQNINNDKSKMKVKRCVAEPDWLVHDLVTRDVRSLMTKEAFYYEVRPKVTVNKSEEFDKIRQDLVSSFELVHENMQSLSNSLTVQKLFTCKINDLFEEDPVQKRFKVKSLKRKNVEIMRQNMRSWERAYKASFQHQSFVRSESEIMHEKKMLEIPVVRGRPEWFKF